jgi:acyl-CoA hydrolase
MNSKTVRESSLVVSYALSPVDANPSGNIHGGIIMKEIDTTAAIVGFRHARANVVTASIDSLDFHSPAFVGELLILKASLNLVGKTSMEIGVRVESENLITGNVRKIASAYLTFVALDDAQRPKEIPGLILETDEDCRRNKEAVERRKLRLSTKEKKKESMRSKCNE